MQYRVFGLFPISSLVTACNEPRLLGLFYVKENKKRMQHVNTDKRNTQEDDKETEELQFINIVNNDTSL
jgi:hypothetical protein